MSSSIDPQEVSSDNETLQPSNAVTAVDAFSQSSSKHASDDGLTMIATAASTCDAAAIEAASAETAVTSASQVAVRGEQEVLSLIMPLPSWTYRIDAYSFSGQPDFSKLRSDGKNSLRGVVQRFKSIRRVGVFETPLERLKNWGTDLRMWRFLKRNEGDNSKWLYHIVIVEPRAPVFHVATMKNAETTAKLEFFTSLARKFYLSAFEANADNTYKIELSLNRDSTAMLLAAKVGNKELPKSTLYLRKNIVVVSAASYRCVCPEAADEDAKSSGSSTRASGSKTLSSRNVDAGSNVMLTWLAVSDKTSPMPAIAASWRRQGIGQFMFILIIKQCAAFGNRGNIEIFLQCHEPGAFRFYCMLGFQRLNSNHDDGFTLLPKNLQDVLFAVPPKKKKGSHRQSTFSFWGDDPEQVGQSVTKLMHLGHQQLRAVSEIDDDAPLVSSATNEKLVLDEDVHIPLTEMWCEYPPPRFGTGGIRLSYSISLIEKLVKNLPLIQELLPPTYANPVPATSLPVKGHMSILRRIIHSHSEGTTWMSSSEMDLMVATLMLDGRYEDSAFVVSFSICESISIAFGLYVSYKKFLKQAATLQSFLDDGVRSAEEVDKCIREQLGHKVSNALSEYNQHMSNLLVKVVSRNPGLLERKIIVFPFCEGLSHWSATFVFNADSIFESIEETNTSCNDGTVLRPCFFRYCSLRNDGTRKVSLDQGVIWFLNLCASYEQHMKANLGSQRISFIEPFGSEIEGNMLGSELFPALRVGEDGYFPMQQDGCNCGIGICATIGIVLRDFLPQNDDFLFDDLFSKANMPLQHCETSCEYFCYMPVTMMKRLPFYDDAKEGKQDSVKDYLCSLREQWFMLFDRMAEFQLVGGPWMLDKNNKPNIAYACTIDLLVWPRGKKRIILKETRDRAALVLQRAQQANPTIQPFVMVGSVVDLTTPTKISQIHNTMDLTTPTPVVQANNAIDWPRSDVMDLKTSTSLVGAKSSNDESDFVLQDTDEEQEIEAFKVSNADGANNDLASQLQGDNKDLGFAVQSDGTIVPANPVVTQSQVLNELGDAHLLRNEDFRNVDTTSVEQSRIESHVNEYAQNQGVPVSVNDGNGLNTDKENSITSFKEPTLTMETDIEAEVVEESTGVLQQSDGPSFKEGKAKVVDEFTGVLQQRNESAVEDDPNKVTVKYLESFNANRLRVPKRPPQEDNEEIYKRLRLDTEDDEISNLSTEKQKKRARDVLQRQVEEDERLKALEAEYESSLRQKICTQSLKTIKKYHDKYRVVTQENEPLMKRDSDYEKELQQFISESFKNWGWDSDDAHSILLSSWAERLNDPNNTEKDQEWIRVLIKALKDERASFKSRLTREFMFTRRSLVKGIKYISKTNTFKARMVFCDVDPTNKNRVMEQEEEMQVDEAWVRDEFSEEDVQHIINMRLEENWVQVPRDIEVWIGKHKIVRVRYMKPRQRSLVDSDALATRLREKQGRRASRARAIRLAYKKKTGKTYNGDILDKEEDDEPLPRKTILINEKWVGRMNNGKETTLDESFVRKNFGDAFTNELKCSVRGYVDVPVGDCKPSHLHLYPHLEVPGAPPIRYKQKDGKDLCVSKSLASALHPLGFEKEAEEIDFYGEEILKGAVVDALDRVMQYARKILPKWVVIERIPKSFNWPKDLLDERHLLVGVLLASDGNCSHAVSIHGGFVYDANELVALPLCQDALDYCTSTAEVKSSFVGFRRGYFLRYKGTKKPKLDRMTLA